GRPRLADRFHVRREEVVERPLAGVERIHTRLTNCAGILIPVCWFWEFSQDGFRLGKSPDVENVFHATGGLGGLRGAGNRPAAYERGDRQRRCEPTTPHGRMIAFPRAPVISHDWAAGRTCHHPGGRSH